MTSRNWEAYVASAVFDLRRAKMMQEANALLYAPASRQARIARSCFRECAAKIIGAPWARCKLLLTAMNELESVEAAARALERKTKKHAKGARL
jgi:hypothetical protein